MLKITPKAGYITFLLITTLLIELRLPDTHYKNTMLSDHIFLKYNLNLDKFEWGTAYQKLNVSHPDNDDNKQGVIDTFKSKDDLSDPISKWGTFKISFCDYSIKYSNN